MSVERSRIPIMNLRWITTLLAAIFVMAQARGVGIRQESCRQSESSSICQMGCCDGLKCECGSSSEIPSERPISTPGGQQSVKSPALVAKAANLVQPTALLPQMPNGAFVAPLIAHLRPPLELHCALLI